MDEETILNRPLTLNFSPQVAMKPVGIIILQEASPNTIAPKNGRVPLGLPNYQS